MFSTFSHSVVLTAVLSSSAFCADLPPAPAISLPEGLEWVVVVRTAKLRETMTGYGLSWDTFGKSAFRQAFNPFSGIPDDAVHSLVIASCGSSKTEYCLVSFRRPITMEEVLKADDATKATGDGDAREIRVPFGTSHRTNTYRRFSPQEFLLTSNRLPGALSQPGRDLSAVRAAVVTQGCLIMGICSGKELSEKVTKGLKEPGGTVGDVVFGVENSDGLRFFGRTECSSPGLATKLTAFAKAMFPSIPSFDEIPQDLRPGLQIASTGKTAGIEARFPKASVGLGIAAFIGGMDNIWKKSGEARAARDAQNIASSYAAGRAAGCEELGAAKSVDEVINILKKGTRPAEGPFASSSFQVSLSRPTPDHRKAVMAMLELKNGDLKYIPPGAGKESAPATPEIVLTAATATAKAKRNAQNIAAVFGAGYAAGAPEFAQVDSVQAAVDAVVKGARGGGQFSNATFQVQVTKSEQKAAMAYLEWDAASGLRYKGGD